MKGCNVHFHTGEPLSALFYDAQDGRFRLEAVVGFSKGEDDPSKAVTLGTKGFIEEVDPKRGFITIVGPSEGVFIDTHGAVPPDGSSTRINVEIKRYFDRPTERE